MKSSFMSRINWLPASFLLCSIALNSAAQQKYAFSFKTPPGISKYTQQHTIDVGDVPGHQIRIAEIQTKFADEAPEFAGVRVTENWARLTSDYTHGNGTFVEYNVLLMANGDRIYWRSEGVTHTSVNADGSRKTAYSNVRKITGGTGKFATIRGVLRASGTTDNKSVSQNPTEGEYWFEQ